MLAVALATASAGWAASSYRVSSLTGSQTTSRSASGSCSTAAGGHRDVVVRCSSSTGHATLTYAFRVPTNAGSIVFCPVPSLSSVGSIGWHISRTGQNVKVTVTVKGAHAHVDMLSAWIGYYLRSTT